MRIGRSPAALKVNEDLPANVTVCVLVCIPSQVGYYKHRFEVLKCCLESIVRNTPRDRVELLVFDNGSCAEVRHYLQQLHDQGTITYLILSSRNLGKVNAFKAIFGTAPGQIVAYSDDDVFFYPGWLDAHLEILRVFPKVGMVSGLPVKEQFRYGNNYLEKYLADFPEVTAKHGEFIPEEWTKDFNDSIGRRADDPPKPGWPFTEILLEHKKVSAYSTATHFQFVALKSVVLEALDPEWEEKIIAAGEKELEERIDARGLARLSTQDRFVRHIGNVITGDFKTSIQPFHSKDELQTWAPPSPVVTKVVGLRLIKALLIRLHNWSYFLIHYRNLR